MQHLCLPATKGACVHIVMDPSLRCRSEHSNSSLWNSLAAQMNHETWVLNWHRRIKGVATICIYCRWKYVDLTFFFILCVFRWFHLNYSFVSSHYMRKWINRRWTVYCWIDYGPFASKNDFMLFILKHDQLNSFWCNAVNDNDGTAVFKLGWPLKYCIPFCVVFQLIKTHNLLPSRNYIFGYHPHGIFCFGAFCNFGTEATGFSKKFPGIKPSLATLAGNFRLPVLRDYLMSGGELIWETRRGLVCAIEMSDKTDNCICQRPLPCCTADIAGVYLDLLISLCIMMGFVVL